MSMKPDVEPGRHGGLTLYFFLLGMQIAGVAACLNTLLPVYRAVIRDVSKLGTNDGLIWHQVLAPRVAEAPRHAGGISSSRTCSAFAPGSILSWSPGCFRST